LRLKKSLLINIVLAIFAASLIFLISEKGLFARLELLNLDFSFRLKGDSFHSPKIVIVEISDSDILEIGRWPWHRSWHAALVKALADLGSKCTYYDIVFSEPSTEEDDKLFEEALRVTRNVYMPFVYTFDSNDVKDMLTPLARFSPYIKDTGATNVFPDIDGIIRKVPLVFFRKDKTYRLHMGLQIAMDYMGMKVKSISPKAIVLSNSSEIKIPLVKKYQMLINWSRRWKDSFIHYSFLDVLVAYKDFLDHKKPHINIDDFKDSICLVGITALGLYDIKAVPVQPEYPGIGIMAAIINNILGKSFLTTMPRWINVLILYILALLPAFLIHGEKPLRETIFVFLISIAYWYVYFFLFTKGLVLGLVVPLLGFFASYISVETYNFIFVSIERQKLFHMSVTDSLTGLYNMMYFKIILKDEIAHARLNPKNIFSLVMIDIDHFKQFNDNYGHQVGDLVLKGVADVLTASVRSVDVVARYGGEEMIILLRGTGLQDALTVAEKIRKGVKDHTVKDQQNTYNVAISLGVSMFQPADNMDTIIKKADEGLYRAKQTGKDRVCTV